MRMWNGRSAFTLTIGRYKPLKLLSFADGLNRPLTDHPASFIQLIREHGIWFQKVRE